MKTHDLDLETLVQACARVVLEQRPVQRDWVLKRLFNDHIGVAREAGLSEGDAARFAAGLRAQILELLRVRGRNCGLEGRSH